MLETLDSLDLARNTVVVFTSDNGYMIGHHGAHGKGNATVLAQGPRRYLPNMFDHSMPNPLAIRWPGVVKAGIRIGQMVTHLDYFPTMLSIAGATDRIPDDCRPEWRRSSRA